MAGKAASGNGLWEMRNIYPRNASSGEFHPSTGAGNRSSAAVGYEMGAIRQSDAGRARVICYFPNASTCRPRRRRTIQNSSTVSKVSDSEVAAAAPWPPKRGTSATHSATFMTKASA